MDIPDAVGVPWAQIRRFPAAEAMAALDNVHACQPQAERLAFLRCNAGIDTNFVASTYGCRFGFSVGTASLRVALIRRSSAVTKTNGGKP